MQRQLSVKLIIFLFFLSQLVASAQPRQNAGVDVCVYGGTSAGVIAAYTAAKMGRTVILIEPGDRLGGLTTGGLGFTDIGNKYVVTGLARDFYRRVGQHYGRFEQWTFEPSVALDLMMDYVKKGGFKVIYQHRLAGVNKTGTQIKSITLESSTGTGKPMQIIAKQFIDCTYEGDLMAKAKVSYTTGREANSVYNETVNGVQIKTGNQLPDGIDPYKIPGKPESGLIWGISAEPLAAIGSGDKKIQSYNFRICLTNDPANRIAITQPANYDPNRYELLLRSLAVKPTKDLSGYCLKMDLMPNHKTDINNSGGFSTDMIGMNYDYPDGSYKTREAIIKAHDDHTKGLLYFIGHDPRMPENLRTQMLQWGYPKDEYLNSDHFTKQLYVREARRMVGEYVMTQANCERKEIVTDGVGMGAYNMDSHNAQRVVVNGMAKNEGDVQLRGISPYPIAYRSIIPKAAECSNLLVPVCLSASHMAYGSIRMEPVFMVLGQSAAVAACQAIDQKTSVQKINISKLQDELKNNPLADRSTSEILVDNDDKQGITTNGAWIREKTGGYGPSYFLDTTGKAEIKFTPQIKQAGTYAIYCYYPKVAHAASATVLNVYNGSVSAQKIINRDEVKVVGQTSGEWVLLDKLQLPAGTNAYVSISTKGANGAVAADAVLFVPVKEGN